MNAPFVEASMDKRTEADERIGCVQHDCAECRARADAEVGAVLKPQVFVVVGTAATPWEGHDHWIVAAYADEAAARAEVARLEAAVREYGVEKRHHRRREYVENIDPRAKLGHEMVYYDVESCPLW